MEAFERIKKFIEENVTADPATYASAEIFVQNCYQCGFITRTEMCMLYFRCGDKHHTCMCEKYGKDYEERLFD